MKPAVVVIPVYREELKLSERVSLRQATQVLGKYDICFMAPERMKDFLNIQGKRAEYWPDNCFGSVRAYSRLLLTPEFYSRFADYEYMLLYQLDAFVFSDRVQEFCDMGYDYIGAPMPHSRTFRTHVGLNGGLSLRKIDSCIRVAALRQGMKMDDEMRQMFDVAEDKFFSYCGGREDIPFTVPNVTISSDFAIEFNVAHCWEFLSPNHLPFGCHAWSKSVYFNLWRPYIEPFVGKEMMNKAAEEAFANGEIDYYNDWIFPSIARYLIKRMTREGRRAEIHDSLQSYFPQGKPVAIWGYGTVGKRCLELFAFAGISIQQIFDKRASGYCADGKIPITPPDKQAIQSKKYIIIVSTTKYYGEIARYLSGLGLKEREDFFPYQEMENHLVRNYYLPIWKRYIEN